MTSSRRAAVAGAGLVLGAGFALVVAIQVADRTPTRALNRQMPWMPMALANFCLGAALRLNARQGHAR